MEREVLPWALTPPHLPTHPLLITQDGLNPVEVHCLESHQHEERVWVVLHFGVEVGGLWVEETHGGLGAHVAFVASHWGVVQSGRREEDAYDLGPHWACLQSLPNRSGEGRSYRPDDHVVLVDGISQRAVAQPVPIAHHHAAAALEAGMGRGRSDAEAIPAPLNSPVLGLPRAWLRIPPQAPSAPVPMDQASPRGPANGPAHSAALGFCNRRGN